MLKYISKEGKNKGTIVFIHGNSSSSNVFSEVLNEKLIGCSLIAIDLPGHGDSLDNHFEDFSFENLKSICTNFINTIDGDILIYGNSFGGNIAIEIAKDINNLKGLIIAGTPPVKKPLNLLEAYLPLPPKISKTA